MSRPTAVDLAGRPERRRARAARRRGGRTPRRRRPAAASPSGSGGRSSAGRRQHGEVAVGVEGDDRRPSTGAPSGALDARSSSARRPRRGRWSRRGRAPTTKPLPVLEPAARLAHRPSRSTRRPRRRAPRSRPRSGRRRARGRAPGRRPSNTCGKLVADAAARSVAERVGRRRAGRRSTTRAIARAAGLPGRPCPARRPCAGDEQPHGDEHAEHAGHRAADRVDLPGPALAAARSCSRPPTSRPTAWPRNAPPSSRPAPASSERGRRRRPRCASSTGSAAAGRRRRCRRPCPTHDAARATKPEAVAADRRHRRSTARMSDVEGVHAARAQARSRRAWVRKPVWATMRWSGRTAWPSTCQRAVQHLDVSAKPNAAVVERLRAAGRPG